MPEEDQVLFQAHYRVSDVKELLSKCDEGAEIWFVHDQGVYFMIPQRFRKPNTDGPYVLHCLEGSEHMAGYTDDFVEHFTVEDILPEDADRYEQVVVTVKENTLEIGLVTP